MEIAHAIVSRSHRHSLQPLGRLNWIAAQKRAFDLFWVIVTLPLTLPLMIGIALALWVCDGGAVIYRAPRAGLGGRRFTVWKFRTMQPVDGCHGGVAGGDKSARISRLGRVLRRRRLDELPQLFNVLMGDMSLVGPRPPDPRYVDRFPQIYAGVLRAKPGLTGLATLVMHRFEDRVLKACATPQETEEVYCRRCIPRKARLDMRYLAMRDTRFLPWLDMVLLARTLVVILRPRVTPGTPSLAPEMPELSPDPVPL